MNIQQLPSEIGCHICYYLSIPELGNFSLASIAYKTIANLSAQMQNILQIKKYHLCLRQSKSLPNTACDSYSEIFEELRSIAEAGDMKRAIQKIQKNDHCTAAKKVWKLFAYQKNQIQQLYPPEKVDKLMPKQSDTTFVQHYQERQKFIDKQLLANLAMLCSRFSENQIAELCETMKGQTNAVQLDQMRQLWNWKLKAKLKQLDSLDLNSRELSSIPREVFELPLQSLSLNSNTIAILPGKIGQLTQMQALHLCNNQLTTLPPQLFQLTSLKILRLNDNKLTTLPIELANLRELKLFTLDNNPFDVPSIPKELDKTACLAVRTKLMRYRKEYNQKNVR